MGLSGVGTSGKPPNSFPVCNMGIRSLTPQVVLRLKGDNRPESSQKTIEVEGISGKGPF